MCACVCVYAHVPIQAGWATSPCLMSLWRQSHVCRPLMQTGWSEYLFYFGSPLGENGALHKHGLQSSFAKSYPSYSQRWDHSTAPQNRSAHVRCEPDSKVGTCWERPMWNHETRWLTSGMHIPFFRRYTHRRGHPGHIAAQDVQRWQQRATFTSHTLSLFPHIFCCSVVSDPRKAKCRKDHQKKLLKGFATDEWITEQNTLTALTLQEGTKFLSSL